MIVERLSFNLDKTIGACRKSLYMVCLYNTRIIFQHTNTKKVKEIYRMIETKSSLWESEHEAAFFVLNFFWQCLSANEIYEKYGLNCFCSEDI